MFSSFSHHNHDRTWHDMVLCATKKSSTLLQRHAMQCVVTSNIYWYLPLRQYLPVFVLHACMILHAYLPTTLPACLPASLPTYFNLRTYLPSLSACLATYLTTYLRMQVRTYIGKYPSMNACMPIYGDKHVTVSEIHMLQIHILYTHTHTQQSSSPAYTVSKMHTGFSDQVFVKVIAQLQLCRKGTFHMLSSFSPNKPAQFTHKQR